jgi:hypothetical protein
MVATPKSQTLGTAWLRSGELSSTFAACAEHGPKGRGTVTHTQTQQSSAAGAACVYV